MQRYNAHQQQLSTELTHCANFPVVQMQQQLVVIQQTLQQLTARINAQ